MELTNKVVMITGAGRGLGRELVSAFLSCSCKIVAIVRSEEGLKDLKDRYKDDRLLVVVADVADAAAVASAVNKTEQALGQVDILFNNAAVYPKVNFLEESADQWDDAIRVNINGVANCCKAVLPGMVARRFGRIYNLGSFADRAPIANSAVYSASKGAIHALTKAIARDIERLGVDIEVHEWIPGHMNTQMSDYTGHSPEVSAQWAVDIVTGRVPYTAKSALFENNREWVAPKSLKQKVLDKIPFWR